MFAFCHHLSHHPSISVPRTRYIKLGQALASSISAKVAVCFGNLPVTALNWVCQNIMFLWCAWNPITHSDFDLRWTWWNTVFLLVKRNWPSFHRPTLSGLIAKDLTWLVPRWLKSWFNYRRWERTKNSRKNPYGRWLNSGIATMRPTGCPSITLIPVCKSR